MIRKIKSIDKLAIFKGFDWDKDVHDETGNVLDFKTINIKTFA